MLDAKTEGKSNKTLTSMFFKVKIKVYIDFWISSVFVGVIMEEWTLLHKEALKMSYKPEYSVRQETPKDPHKHKCTYKQCIGQQGKNSH